MTGNTCCNLLPGSTTYSLAIDDQKFWLRTNPKAYELKELFNYAQKLD